MHSRTRAAPARLLPVGWWSPNRGISTKTLALLATGLVRFCNDVPDQPTGRRRLFGRANIVTQSEGDSSSGRRALPTILVSIVWSTIWSNVMIPHRICQHGRRSSSSPPPPLPTAPLRLIFSNNTKPSIGKHPARKQTTTKNWHSVPSVLMSFCLARELENGGETLIRTHKRTLAMQREAEREKEIETEVKPTSPFARLYCYITSNYDYNCIAFRQ